MPIRGEVCRASETRQQVLHTNLEKVALAVRPPDGGAEVGRDTGPTLRNPPGPHDQRFSLQVEVPVELALKEIEVLVPSPQQCGVNVALWGAEELFCDAFRVSRLHILVFILSNLRYYNKKYCM